MGDHERDLYDLGLAADLAMLQRTRRERRRILTMGAAGIGLLLAGGAALAQTDVAPSSFLPAALKGDTATPTAGPTAAPGATPAAGAAACVSAEIPRETAGPYPADGSNASSQSLNVLMRSGIVRSDIRTSLGTGATAAGVPLTIELALVDPSGDCAPLAGYAVYLWHCDSAGRYSLYSSGVTGEDYLRGVQAADSSGRLTFTTIYPGCYLGRWPHVHFEIYASLAQATGARNAVHTSQLALPQDVCETVYAGGGYGSSLRNMGQITLASDNVFGDGYGSQMAALSGDAASGYMARLTVGVDV